MSDKQIYVSQKRVTIIPMNRSDYNEYRGWELPEDEDGSDEGYLVEYLDGGKTNHPDHEGYISWSPKDVFDAQATLESELLAKEEERAKLTIAANEEIASLKKTLNNSDVNHASQQVGDLEVFGNGDLFRLVSKASSKEEGWMKSTKACNLPNGVLVQVTTQQGDNVAEALCFVPNVTFDPQQLKFVKVG